MGKTLNMHHGFGAMIQQWQRMNVDKWMQPLKQLQKERKKDRERMWDVSKREVDRWEQENRVHMAESLSYKLVDVLCKAFCNLFSKFMFR